MNPRLIILIALLLTIPSALACKKTQTKTVTLTLSSTEPNGTLKPFADEEIAIFPVDGDNISVGDKNRLGSGKTDSKGHASIEFNGAAPHKEFVLLWRTKNIYMMLRTHEGNALTFKCENPTCDLGNVTFEVFEFSFKSG